jgi:hypothetical protein
MKMCSGRWRVAMGLGAALAIVGGFTPSVRAADKGRPLFPWRKQQSATSIPQAASRGNVVVLPDALTLEDESPLTSISQSEPPKPPSSSTGQAAQTPAPPPPLQKPAPLGGATPAAPAEPLTPVPNAMGEVLGGPIPGEVMQGDQFPVFYRDRPVGNRATQAEIITRNRSSEHAWYREWRIRYYGYYPTQWRPFPEGWHLGRNIPPAPYVHPYDLKQPDPDPNDERPKTPRRMRDQEREREEGATPPSRDPAPPLRTTPGAGNAPAPGPGANPGGTLTPNPDRNRRTFP